MKFLFLSFILISFSILAYEVSVEKLVGMEFYSPAFESVHIRKDSPRIKIIGANSRINTIKVLYCPDGYAHMSCEQEVFGPCSELSGVIKCDSRDKSNDIIINLNEGTIALPYFGFGEFISANTSDD